MTGIPAKPNCSPANLAADEGLRILYGICEILAVGKYQKQTLAEVLDILDNEHGMLRGTIALLSPDGSELTIEVAHNFSPAELKAVRYQLGEGITGRVVQTGQLAIVPKISQEPAFLDRLQRRKHRPDEELSFLCVPISVGSQVIGALSAERLFDPAVDLDRDARMLSIVASMIAHDVHFRRTAAADRQALESENTRLRGELEDRWRPENIIGNSGAMREVYQSIHQVAASDTTVLIRGESGTGKELV
ncbi:MAG: GAF domain-containing protein, partial [Planctomycetota bacterium]